MLVDKNIKDIYAGGNKILAVMHKGKIIWGHIEENLNIIVYICVRKETCTVVVHGKEYKLGQRTFKASKTEFTFTVKVDEESKKRKYDIMFNREIILKDEEGSAEGKEYTVTLDKLKKNNIYIIFKK